MGARNGSEGTHLAEALPEEHRFDHLSDCPAHTPFPKTLIKSPAHFWGQVARARSRICVKAPEDAFVCDSISLPRIIQTPVPIASHKLVVPTSLLRVFEVFLNRRRPVGHPSCSWRDCDKMVITVGLPNISIARCAPYLCFFCIAAPLLSGPRSCDARGSSGSWSSVLRDFFLKGFS
ncbi:hypothetical protein CDAR_437551 [Caerostris darwini]|uniref:Uncharacterized protein n=1 Tax=Caerostris darwini TaxID=1538125 RepID=A0AAV4NWG6_9ARAC|nr:hypothetical protein CDAR_437551 [Caerostris darwini]